VEKLLTASVIVSCQIIFDDITTRTFIFWCCLEGLLPLSMILLGVLASEGWREAWRPFPPLSPF